MTQHAAPFTQKLASSRGWHLGLLIGLLFGHATATNAASVYCVVVSEATYGDGDWRKVADTLVAKHHAQLIRYDGDVRNALPVLQAWLPDYVGFVARPEEANRDFVVQVSRLTREIDPDPYTDAIWGIVTGYEAADALRMVKQSEPLRIRRAMSSMGPGVLNRTTGGLCTAETVVGALWTKRDGELTKTNTTPDVAAVLAEAFQAVPVDYLVTSGHATERDWQIGFNIRNGEVRSERGQLYTRSTTGQKFPFHSDSPKVYVAAGNCLIGNIPDREALALAWMHSGGVNQMVGYTVVTFFGYSGWGTGEFFDRGQHNLAESFFFSSQSLLHQLATRFPQGLEINLPVKAYEPKFINQIIGPNRMTKDQGGMVWDRDTVAFYGDPGWDARWPQPTTPWKQTLHMENGRGQFVIETTADGKWPSRPVAALLPERLQNITVTSGTNYNPVVTDNFILVPLTGQYKAGERVEIEFTGQPLQRPNRAAQAKLDLLQTSHAERRQALEFLMSNMPAVDYQRVTAAQLDETVTLALQARTDAPWGKTIPWDVFLNDVLPYANLDEARDPWRKDLMDRFGQRAWQEKTPADAAQMLNREIFKELKVTYHATQRPRPNQSPIESSIEAGFASCTGLSILLVDACRAGGIPARVAGISEWAQKDDAEKKQNPGNHTWVEIWSDGQWHYVGAAEPGPLDQTWFTGAVQGNGVNLRSPANRIYAASFRRTDTPYRLPWAPQTRWVSALDVTDRYRPAVAGTPKEP